MALADVHVGKVRREQPAEQLVHHQRHLGAARGDQRRIAHELDGVAGALLGVEQHLLAGDVLALPRGASLSSSGRLNVASLQPPLVLGPAGVVVAPGEEQRSCDGSARRRCRDRPQWPGHRRRAHPRAGRHCNRRPPACDAASCPEAPSRSATVERRPGLVEAAELAERHAARQMRLGVLRRDAAMAASAAASASAKRSSLASAWARLTCDGGIGRDRARASRRRWPAPPRRGRPRAGWWPW